MSEWMLIVKLNKLSGAMGFRVCQRDFVSALHVTEMMKKMQRRSFSTLVTVAKIPSEGLKGLSTIVYMLQSCYFYKIWVTVVS